ncbi:lysosomal alpha-mannosidase-like [Euwallacea similis]|uniref:lysosomal alpha-mannosidase-like n=1 Tax=Euwallacea similis TaxID=1736056 RepID=UPI00344C2F13
MVQVKILLALVAIVVLAYEAEAECGYQSCHETKDDHLNIHLIPHTHDDLGWIKTYEQLYYGSHDNVYRAGVQYILRNVVKALQENKDRRFIYVETGFFWKWWVNQDEDTRDQVRELVNNGQLEFISGGWSMNDEATTYYQTVIDQMTWGMRRLNDTFGECGRPKVAWQIDPFGHSREMASIFSQIGFDAFFLNRIDYQDKDIRNNNKGLEFIWRGSPDNLGESTDIFTNILFRHYSAPGGLCFDENCSDEPIIDDPDSPEYNVEQKINDFINNWINPAKAGYPSNNLLVTMGDDFQYENAVKNFLNMDKLISNMNGKEIDGVKYNVIYSTPSCYLNAVYKSLNGTLKSDLKTDDFFPYGSSASQYWTGYFSSRPTGKGYGRFSNNFMQVCKQLAVFTNATSEDDFTKINTLREALGVFQHHDAMTGTEREDVAHDYIRLLHKGITQCEEVTSQALSKLANVDDTTFTTCHYLNISQCDVTENQDNFIITLYNPLGKSVTKFVRLPIVEDTNEIIITDPEGNQLTTQILPVHEAVLTTPGRDSKAKFDLVFEAENIPPLGYKSFYYQKTEKARPKYHDEYQINDWTKTTHGPKIVKKTEDGIISVAVEFLYYSGAIGDNPSSNYIFRPDPDIPIQALSDSPSYTAYTGPLVTEYHWKLNDWGSFVTRNYSGSKYVEVNYLIGPLPYDEHGVEVIARFTTDLEYDDKIYTDVNGREIIERVRDFRPTWNFTVTEPESGNYFPIVTGVTLKNDTAGIALLTDRAQGGGSVSYQNVEFMIHRNTIKDCCGVGQALNEQAYDTGVVTRGTHYVLYTGLEENDLTAKELSQQVYLNSWTFFSSSNDQSFEDYSKSHVMQFSGVNEKSLPRNVHILTVEPWSSTTVLLRLENFVGKEETDNYGSSTVNIEELFTAFKIVSLRETNLSANQWSEEVQRMMFNRNGPAEVKEPLKDDDFDIALDPLQIRTFVVEISY